MSGAKRIASARSETLADRLLMTMLGKIEDMDEAISSLPPGPWPVDLLRTTATDLRALHLALASERTGA